MNKLKYFVLLTIILACALFININTISAANIQKDDNIYFINNNDWEDVYIYMFDRNGTYSPPFNWQNDQGLMTDTGETFNGHKVYKYTLTNSDWANKYWMVIFTSKKNGKQTKNLTYLRNNIYFSINTSAISSGEGTGNYDGAWYIKDKTQLNDLVTLANSLDENMYTEETFQILKNNLTNYESIINEDLTLVTWDNTSEYDNAVINIDNAIKALIMRNKIVKKSNVGGSIESENSDYFDDNSTINFHLNVLDGYEVEELTITKIVGYNNDGSPILSEDSNDITKLDLNDNNEYSYTAANNDIYINVKFKKKQYTITTNIDNNGIITPEGPFTVEYGDNQTLTITPNEGYEINTVTVNENDYTVSNNQVVLNDITENMEINVTFQIITLTVTIDNQNYQLPYGSKITDLNNYNNITNKEGYVFKGFNNNQNQIFDESTEIKNNIVLTTKFEQIISPSDQEEQNNSNNSNNLNNNNTNHSNEINNNKDENKKIKSNTSNPNTGDKILFSFIGILISILGIPTLLYFRKRHIIKD